MSTKENTLLPFRPTVAEVNLNHLRHNYRVIKNLMDASTWVCPMVKSDAYGHGAIPVTQALVAEGATSVGVALVEEGVELRQAEVGSIEILVFGCFNGPGAKAIEAHQLIPVVSTWSQLKLLASKVANQISIHLKFNTGMYRLGFDPSQAAALSQFLEQNPKLKLKGVCTHLSDGEDACLDQGKTHLQVQQFKKLEDVFTDSQLTWHCLNSAGIVASYCRTGELVGMGARPGISLYGVLPVIEGLDSQQQARWEKIELKSVMAVKTSICQVHAVPAQSRVSYCGKWQAPVDSTVAVLPIGYADGFFRAFSNKGRVLVRGQRAPVVGIVCMDYTLVDISAIVSSKPAYEGEEVVVFGSQDKAFLPVSELAGMIDTISYEILTSVGQRVPRHYVGQQ